MSTPSNGNGGSKHSAREEPDWSDPACPAWIRKGFLYQSERMKDLRQEVLGEIAEVKGISLQSYALQQAVALRTGINEREIKVIEGDVDRRIKREREARLKLQSTIDEHGRRLVAVENDVEDTGQRNIEATQRKVAEFEAKEKADAAAKAENVRYWVRMVLGAILLAFMGWVFMRLGLKPSAPPVVVPVPALEMKVLK